MSDTYRVTWQPPLKQDGFLLYTPAPRVMDFDSEDVARKVRASLKDALGIEVKLTRITHEEVEIP